MPMIYEAPVPCKCEGKPNPSKYGVGSIWQCDNCGTQYELCRESEYNTSFQYWAPKE